MPIACVSMIVRNSLRSGSGASAAMIRMLSSSGRPALMPRTMVSTASGNASRNFVSRRFLRYLSSQTGMPKPAANAIASAAYRPASIKRNSRNEPRPSATLIRMY